MNKKKVLYLSLVVIMVAILSFTSLAWFTDSDSALNDFTVNGAGEDDADEIFSVDVKENVDGEDAPVDEMDFEGALPGDFFKKEAYVTNTGANEQYIRVTLTVSDWALIKDIVEINMDDAFDTNWYIDSEGVELVNGNLATTSDASVDADGNLVVVLYLDKKLAAGETVDLMDSVSISGDATQADFAADGFADGFQIDVKADAVQTENLLPSYGADEWQNARESFEAL